MDSRMSKYSNEEEIPTRSDKNKMLYKQIYNAYDEFENLIVPSNAREISLDELKLEVSTGNNYKSNRDTANIVNNKVARKEQVVRKQKEENQIYDINELLNDAISKKEEDNIPEVTLTNEDYLKKLNLDSGSDIQRENTDSLEGNDEVEESLLKTANLSLEILSDLKGDSDDDVVLPIETDDVALDNYRDTDFYSNTYRFSKKDFDDKKYEENIYSDDDVSLDKEKHTNFKFFFKILLLIFGILLVVIVLLYLFNYFNRV